MFQSMNYIYEIYQEGSFSKAAKKLYMTQPALSIAVKKEEAELGQPLFERSSSPLVLTEAGKAYIDSVRKIKEIESSLRQYCNDLSQLKTGSLRLGASNFILSQVMLPVIADFSDRYPGIHIDIQEAPSMELKSRILRNELDIIIDPMSFDDELFAVYPLIDDIFILAVPKEWSVNKKLTSYALTYSQICSNIHLSPSTPGVPLSEFSEEPFLLLRQESITYERAMKLCALYNFTPTVRFYLDQLITACRFAENGLGIAFITDTVIKRNPCTSSLIFYKIDSPLAKREIAAVHKKNIYMSNLFLEFIRTAEQVLKYE